MIAREAGTSKRARLRVGALSRGRVTNAGCGVEVYGSSEFGWRRRTNERAEPESDDMCEATCLDQCNWGFDAKFG